MTHTAHDRTPYTYVVRFPLTNELYYGVRYAVGCSPSDLGVTYFTSSRMVARRLKQDTNAVFEVRKVFNSVEKAKIHETRVLRRLDAKNHPNFLNRHNNDGIYPIDNRGEKNPAFGKPGTMLGRKHSAETIAKMRDAKLGKTWNFGKGNSEESKRKASDSQRGENSSKFKGWYHTPIGKFASKRLAAEALGVCVRGWCKQPDRVISKLAVAKSTWLQPHHVGLTFRQLGFWFQPTN